MAKHTAAPWREVRIGDSAGWIEDGQGDKLFDLTVSDPDGYEKNAVHRQHNLKLCAHSPFLLNACLQVLETLRHMPATGEPCTAAQRRMQLDTIAELELTIARATGEEMK